MIKGDRVEHFSPDQEAALTWAYQLLGLNGFFVKRITPDGGVAWFPPGRVSPHPRGS